MNSAASDSRPPGDLYCPTCERTYFEGGHCPTDGTKLVRIKAQIDPLLGRNLDGRYTIVEKLGQGGMGAVYRGTQHSVGREIAIKVISAHLVSDRDAIKRFLREAKLASRLSHPNAVSVMEFGQTDDGLLYLVMELVTGRTLDQVIKGEHVLRPERVVRIGSQVCDALEGAHALQIVHRDLKPANIMLLSQGRDLVKVLDFGLAKSIAPDQAATTMTNAGALLGTPAYMPPELALGGACDARADLYSLGVILYLLGSGRLPFESESPHELIAMHGHESAPPMTGVPPALAAVVDRLLQKDPNKRFQSATETREALDAALDARMPTPPAGTAFHRDSAPSIGPFPATPNQYAHLTDTPTPRTRSQSERHRIASSDTIVAAAGANSMVPGERAKSSRGMLIGVIALALIGAGIGAFVMMNGAETPRAEPAAQPQEPAAAVTPPSTPPPSPPPAPVKPPEPAAVVEPTPLPTPPTPATDVAAPTAKPPTVTTKKPATVKSKPATVKTKPATTSKPSTTGTGSTTTTKPAAGSAAPNKGLPF